VVDKHQKAGRQLESIEHVQQVVEGLGSVQNVQLLALLRSRFVLFVEGDDKRILKAVAEKLGMHGVFDTPTLSVVPLEGEGNWGRLKDLNWIWKNTIGEEIRSFVLLDRDYETDTKIRSVTRTLRGAGVGVHVWAKKELENYLLVPYAILAAIVSGNTKRGRAEPSLKGHDIMTKLMEFADAYRDFVSGQLLGRILAERRTPREDPATTSTRFLQEFARRWRFPTFRLARVPGKEIISDLSRWSQSAFGVSLSREKILRHMRREDIQPELAQTIKRIVDRAQSN
jgi:hypothetical protein